MYTQFWNITQSTQSTASMVMLRTVFLFPFLFTLLHITKRLTHSMLLHSSFHAVSSFFSFNYLLQPHFSY